MPFKEGITEEGAEYFEFEVEPLINEILNGYKLVEASKTRSVLMNQAMDGACLTNNLHHTTFGVKVADVAARDPSTGEFIYGNNTQQNNVQSKFYCHPIKMILARGNKK